MVYSALSDDSTMSQFTRRKKIHINSSEDGALTNFQIMLTISYESAMQSLFQDIRFAELDNSYINYWIESSTESTTADVWIKTNVPASGGKDIYMYYGNAALADGGDIGNTFIFGDDFDNIDNWVEQAGSWAVSNSILSTPVTTGAYLRSANELSVSDEYITRWRTRIRTAGNTEFAGFMKTNNPLVLAASLASIIHDNNNLVYLAVNWGGWYNDVTPIIANTWYKPELVVDSAGLNTARVYDDSNNLLASVSNAADSSGGDFFGFRGDSNHPCDVDYMYIRKYIANEPTTSIGTEQHQRRVPIFIG